MMAASLGEGRRIQEEESSRERTRKSRGELEKSRTRYYLFGLLLIFVWAK